MSSMAYDDHGDHIHKHDLSFKGLLPYTATGVGSVALIKTLQLLDYARTPFSEGVVRFFAGTSDSFSEGIYVAVNLREYLKGHGRRNRVAYYVSGRLAGALLSWLPHLILANTRIDIHSSFPGAIIPVAYAQLDQLGGCMGILIYYNKEFGMKKGFEEFVKDPVARTSLALFLISLGLDGFTRMYLRPDNFWIDFLETWPLSFSCLLTALVGAKSENKK